MKPLSGELGDPASVVRLASACSAVSSAALTLRKGVAAEIPKVSFMGSANRDEMMASGRVEGGVCYSLRLATR